MSEDGDALLALADEISKTDRALRELRTKFDDQLGRLHRRVDGTKGQLDEIQTMLAQLVTEDEDRRFRGWWWPDLDADQAAEAWERLGDWVTNVLRARYPVYSDQLQVCWRYHPDVVDELSAIYVVWLDAYRNPRTLVSAQAEFLDRWLPNAMRRIASIFEDSTSCGPKTHDDARNVNAERERNQAGDADAFVRADLAKR